MPRLRDGLLGHVLPDAVVGEPAVDAGDGQYARELHNPPDEYLHSQQRVAHP